MRWRDRNSVLFFLLLALAVLSYGYLRYGKGSPGPAPRPSASPSFPPEIPPLLGRFRPGTVEDYAGVRCETPRKGERRCILEAIDGAGFRALWNIGPFEGQAASGLRTLLVADRVIVADGTGWVGVHSAATGKLVAQHETGGALSALCRSPEPGTLVWLGKEGDAGMFLDAASGQVTAGARPDWCPRLPDGLSWRPRARLVPADQAAPILSAEEGFTASLVLESGGAHVAVGYRLDVWNNKTATAIRFDPRARTILWRRTLGDHVDKAAKLGGVELTGRTMVVFYPQRVLSMFAVLDVATGEVRCSRSVGGPMSLVSPTAALSDDRVAFFQGPIAPDLASFGVDPGRFPAAPPRINLILRSTTTCEDLPPP